MTYRVVLPFVYILTKRNKNILRTFSTLIFYRPEYQKVWGFTFYRPESIENSALRLPCTNFYAVIRVIFKWQINAVNIDKQSKRSKIPFETKFFNLSHTPLLLHNIFVTLLQKFFSYHRNMNYTNIGLVSFVIFIVFQVTNISGKLFKEFLMK